MTLTETGKIFLQDAKQKNVENSNIGSLIALPNICQQSIWVDLLAKHKSWNWRFIIYKLPIDIVLLVPLNTSPYPTQQTDKLRAP